jgi:hypothetical protein
MRLCLLVPLVGLGLLGGCLSEINKPIRPGDRWPDRATSIDTVPAP